MRSGGIATDRLKYEEPPPLAGALEPVTVQAWRRLGSRPRLGGGIALPGLDAAAARVRPLVLVAEAARKERRGRPGALVVELGAGPAVPPAGPDRIGHGLAGFVADEVVLVLRRSPARERTAAAARIGLDGVLDRGGAAAVPAVIGAVREVRSAAGVLAAIVGIGGAGDDDLVDRAVVDGIARQVPLNLGLDVGVG